MEAEDANCHPVRRGATDGVACCADVPASTVAMRARMGTLIVPDCTCFLVGVQMWKVQVVCLRERVN